MYVMYVLPTSTAFSYLLCFLVAKVLLKYTCAMTPHTHTHGTLHGPSPLRTSFLLEMNLPLYCFSSNTETKYQVHRQLGGEGGGCIFA